MTGQTGDISYLCEFERFQRIMFYEPMSSYLDNNAQIGGWLGPIDDVGTTLTYKVLKNNELRVCRGAIRAWTPEDEANPAFLRQREVFVAAIYDIMGRTASLMIFLRGS